MLQQAARLKPKLVPVSEQAAKERQMRPLKAKRGWVRQLQMNKWRARPLKANKGQAGPLQFKQTVFG